MKGIIAKSLKQMVIEKFGEEKWEEVLRKSGLDEGIVLLAMDNIDDGIVINIIKAICEVFGISMQQAADLFGEYWVCEFAPKYFSVHYIGKKNAKEFLLSMDDVHVLATKNIQGATPPRFGYSWKDEKTLIMTYKSKRGLIDIMVGLIKGVGKYYKENLTVNKISHDRVEIIFP